MSTSRFDSGSDSRDTELLASHQYRYAGELLSRGKLVVIPTETVYGLGASAVDRTAIESVFRAKDRPRENPLIVHLGVLAAAVDLVPPELGLTRRILETYAPGPITVILPAPAWAGPEVRGGLSTIALRVPSPDLTRRVISAAGVPIAAPSANRSGRPSPTTAAMAHEEMSGRVAAILDGGPCTVGIESTIVDARSDRDVVILRPGRVTAAEISRDLGCAVRFRDDRDVPTPGTRYRHYTPRIPVVLVPAGELDAARRELEDARRELDAARRELEDARRELEDARREVGHPPADTTSSLNPTGHDSERGEPVAGSPPPGPLPVWTELSVHRFGDFATYEEHLYRTFREAEQAGHALILAELPPEGFAEGLADRLHRAAAGPYRRGNLRSYIRAGTESWL